MDDCNVTEGPFATQSKHAILITSPWKEAHFFLAMSIVFPDAVNIRTPFQVPDEVLRGGEGAGGVFDLSTGEVHGEYARDSNVYVRRSASGTLFSGSLRNWANAQGIVSFETPFGHEQAGLTLDALGDANRLPTGALRDATLTMIEGTIDLLVPRPASDYIRAFEDVPRTRMHRWDGTTLSKTGEQETKAYDPPAKFHQKREPVPDLYKSAEKSGHHVLRIEHTLKSGGVARHLKQFATDGVVRSGLLADAEFRADLARFVIEKARTLRFGRVTVPERSGMSSGERNRWEIVQGIEAAGGLDAALDAVRSEHAAGHITANQKKYRLQRYRQLYRDKTVTIRADLDAEFGLALDAVERTYTT